MKLPTTPTLICACLQLGLAVAQDCSDFPIVDLGYAKHAPTQTNYTFGNIEYATYANIRFAQPPVGDLRFRKPQLPPPFNSSIQDGVVPRNSTNCINSIPPGVAVAPGVEGTTWGSEDCLFLDIKVPAGLQGQKVPVLLWFYGGGYFFGSKEPWAGDPAGLFQRMDTDQKFVAVSANYRLGMLGWLAPDVDGVDKNVGLYDAEAALLWVNEYISYFGGDPDDITIIGESAGGGIGQHLLTAYGGEKKLPIKKAILTSPGFRPHVARQADLNYQFDLLLNATNCTDIACVRTLPSDSLLKANSDLLFNFNLSEGWIGPGIGIGGPVPDGDLVPDIPWRLLNESKYQKGVDKILVGNPINDGLYATVFPADNWEDELRFFMATPTQDTVSQLSALYPQNLTDAFNMLNGDVVFKCHSYFMASAFGTNAYKYYMSISPATHGQDQFYYFYGNTTADGAVEFPDVALQMQSYFRSFILDDYPGGQAGDCPGTQPHWPSFGASARWMNITADGFQLETGDDFEAQRCQLILATLNDAANGW